MKYGACTLIDPSCSAEVASINAQVSSETRTDCTQPNSKAVKPIDLLKAMAPTEPPGFFGVPLGDPTVPKRNDKVILSPLRMPWYAQRLKKILNLSHNGGPKIKTPINIAASAEISTAAAPTSFPTFARGCFSGLAKSTTASIAVLMNSAVKTMAIVRISTAQSRAGS